MGQGRLGSFVEAILLGMSWIFTVSEQLELVRQHFLMISPFLDYKGSYVRNQNEKHWLTQIKTATPELLIVLYRENYVK